MKLFKWEISALTLIAQRRKRDVAAYLEDYRQLALATGKIHVDTDGVETHFEVDEGSAENKALMDKYRSDRARSMPPPALLPMDEASIEAARRQALEPGCCDPPRI